MSNIGRQILRRRTELGITQEQLAKMVGYKSTSTIAKVETGASDITLAKVEEFAKALKTTPAYIMGWEDEEPVDYIAKINDDDVLIEVFDNLASFNDKQRGRVLQYVKMVKEGLL